MRTLRRDRDERGFALLLVFVMAAAIAISLYMEMPRVAFETQRTREQLLVERGEEYKRAIQLYVRKFRRYPQSLDDLEKSQNIRFLRKRFKDPLTGKEEWRLVHSNGMFLTDSLVEKPPDVNARQTGIGSGSPGTSGTADQQQQQQQQQAPGVATAAQFRPSDRGVMPPPGSVWGMPQDPNNPQADPNAQPADVEQQRDLQTTPSGVPYPQPGQPQTAPSGAPYPGQPQYPQPGQSQTMPSGVPYPGQQPYAQPGQPQTMPSGVPYPGQVQTMPSGVPYPGQGQTMPSGVPYPGQGQTMPSGVPYPGQAQPGVPGQPPAFPNPAQPIQPQPFPQPVQVPGGVISTQPGAPYPQPYPGQPNPQYPGQPYSGQPYPGQPYPGQPAQPYPGQPYPGQRIPVQQRSPYPGQQPQPGTIYPVPVPVPGAPSPYVRPGSQPYVNPAVPPAPTPGSQGSQNPPTQGQNQAIGLIRDILTNPRPGGPQGAQQQGQTFGAGIAGVASTFEGDSIRVYNERSKYQEWEFVYDPRKDTGGQRAGVAAPIPGQSQQSGSGSTGSFGGTSSIGSGSTFGSGSSIGSGSSFGGSGSSFGGQQPPTAPGRQR